MIIDSDEANQALRIVAELKKRPVIQEVPNPAYAKRERERRTFHPVRGSLTESAWPLQPSLAEQEKDGYKRYETDALLLIRDICDICPECSDCCWAGEMAAIDRCRVVKKNMEYYVGAEKK